MKSRALPLPLVLAVTSITLGCAAFGLFIFYHNATVSKKAPSGFPPALSLNPNLLAAKAAIVYDPGTKRVLFQKNATESLPLASLTKLMTAQTVLSSVSPTTSVTITLEDLKPDGDWGFNAGDVVKLSDLLKFGLAVSSNDAMAAAAASLGSGYLDDMNRTANSLGLTQTYFLNSTGLDLNTDTSGAYGSAYDVARLASVFLKDYPQYFELTNQPKVSIKDGNRTLSAAATALPLLNIPGFIGAKTGYTDLAGGNLVAAFDVDINHPLIAVVLGSSEEGRFDDIRTLITASRAALASSTTP